MDRRYIILTILMVCVFAAWLPAATEVTEEQVAKMRAAMPDKPVVKPEQPRTLLVFNLSNGFKHEAIPYWAKALEVMAEKTGAFKVEHSEDMGVFATETLRRFDAICFNNTTKLVFDDAQKKALLDFIQGGKGIVGIHAATDNFYEWPEAATMIGGQFSGHPWCADGTWAIKIDDPNHPLTQSFGGKGFKVKDEIYRTQAPFYSRSKQRVLLSLDMADEATRTVKDIKPEDMDTGISWIKRVGNGRLFYCSLGHNTDLTWTTTILEHYLAGIQYAMGDLKADDKPLGIPVVKLDTAAVAALIDKVKEYDWTKSRTDLTALEEIIRSQSGNAENLRQIETLMQPLLAPEMAFAVKDFACRQLSVFATKQSVPALEKLLDDPKTEHLARYALERIDGPMVDRLFLVRLDTAQNSVAKVGIITSLGVRRCKDAVDVLSKIAIGYDKLSAHAAIASLGRIATPEAAAALIKIQKLSLAAIKMPVLDALAVCADGLYRSGNTAAAVKIYQSLYVDSNPGLIRIAALNGLAQADNAEFQRLLPGAVLSDDPGVQAAAIQLVATVKDLPALGKMVSVYDKLGDTAKISMLAALMANGSTIGYSVAIGAIHSDNAEVRIMAYNAISRLGGSQSVMPLAVAAAAAANRTEKIAARQALYQLKGQDINAAIETGILQTTTTERDENAAVELIRAAAERCTESAKPRLFTAARDQNSSIAQEAIRALQLVAGSQDMSAMVDLLADSPSSAMENAVVVVAEKIPDRNHRSAALLAKWETLDAVKAKASFLQVLGRLGSVNTIDLLRSQKASSDAVISEAAFQAMTDWPGPELTDDMKYLATTLSDTSQKVLAFRAYLRMLTLNKTQSDPCDVELLAEAMAMSDRPQEQRLVLGALGSYGTLKALQLAQKMMDNPDLKAESEAAILAICERLIPTDSKSAKAALEAIDATTTNIAIKEGVELLLKRTDYITVWEMDGPYTESGSSGLALDAVFAPEKDPKAVQWKPLPKPEDQTKFWYMDLLKALGGTDRVAYVRTILVSEQDADAILELGSDDGIKVWLNGQIVHRNDVMRGVVPGNDKVSVRLGKGDNSVMMKITQGGSGWGFCLRVTHPDGSPMRKLIVK